MATLQQVLYLNNQGVSLLSSSNPNATKLALQYLNQALAMATRCDAFNVPVDAGRHLSDQEVWEICGFPAIQIDFLQDSAFYVFNHAVWADPEALATVSCQSEKTATLLAVITLFNTALGFTKLADLTLATAQDGKTGSLYRKSLQLYAHVTEIIKGASQTYIDRTLLFFLVVAQNNYLYVALQLGLSVEAASMLEAMEPLLEQWGHVFFPDAMPCIEEVMLNTTILRMTNIFASLPAAAA